MNILLLLGFVIVIGVLLIAVYQLKQKLVLDYKESQLKFSQDLQQQVLFANKILAERVEGLRNRMDDQLQLISKDMGQKLTESFAKNTETFTDVVKRLALIDAAQQKMTELSSQVLNLQAILSNKKARGAFGEVQLANLVGNMLPEGHFQLQATLSNGTRVDCLLILPPPTGNIAIDAKFPLENYERWIQAAEGENKAPEAAFVKDIKKHIDDIQQKYIIPGETCIGAVMFIPAEAIFADIHAHFREVVDYAQQKQVWLVSPTTMMAVLTTARAVLKDRATEQHVQVVREQLQLLAQDFERFHKRAEQMEKHIEATSEDVRTMNISGRKILEGFKRIERGELEYLAAVSATKVIDD
jgi:DNA recombination protein RmuC